MTAIRKETKRRQDIEETGYIYQRGKYYEPCSRSMWPRELKEKQRCLSLFVSIGGTTTSTLLGRQRRTNSSNTGEPIRTRKGKLAGRGKHVARLGCVVQVTKHLNKKRGKWQHGM